MNKSKLPLIFLIIFGIALITLGIFYFDFMSNEDSDILFQQKKKDETEINVADESLFSQKELEEFPKKYIDESGIQWKVFGKYEVAIRNDDVVIRSSEDHQEIYRVLKDRILNFSRDEGISYGSIVYWTVNDTLRKMYLFVDVPELSGVTGTNILWHLLEIDLNESRLGDLSRFATEQSGYTKKDITFSPDGKFMSYIGSYPIRMEQCMLVNNYIIVYDLLNKNHQYKVNPTIDLSGYSKKYFSKANEDTIVANIISYDWFGDDAMNLTIYYSSCFKKNYPKEIWQFNFKTQKYTFIKRLDSN